MDLLRINFMTRQPLVPYPNHSQGDHLVLIGATDIALRTRLPAILMHCEFHCFSASLDAQWESTEMSDTIGPRVHHMLANHHVYV